MSIPVSPESQGTSTRPYLIRALHDWCTDNGFTPYLAVFVDASVQVPMEYVKNREIVLNISFEATSGLQLGNEHIEFRARFGGMARDIFVPIDHVVAIYARENGQGMAFPLPPEVQAGAPEPTPAPAADVEAASAPAPSSAPVIRLPSPEAPVPPRPRATKRPASSRKKSEPPATEAPPDPAPKPGRPALKRVK
ncbi:MAG: ClpXP protease specificity-enhancing factor [Rubrivivax sp.]